MWRKESPSSPEQWPEAVCHCPAVLRRQQQAQSWGLPLPLAYKVFIVRKVFCVILFSSTYPSKARNVGAERQASGSVMHNTARRTQQGVCEGRAGISCVLLITERKGLTVET